VALARKLTRPCDGADRPSRLRHGPCNLQDLQDERVHRARNPERLEKIFNSKEEKTMLWTIIAILVVLWLLGLIGHIGGGLIHLLLVIAAIVLIYQLISGRRAVV
jgi:4-hydroxybenzoate polyprenyltransferase